MKIYCLVENTAVSSVYKAEHGLSLLLETDSQRLLFDTGASTAFAENATRMGIELAKVDLAVLSHGHYDHGGGLHWLLENHPSIPVWMSPHAFSPHYNAKGRFIGLDKALAHAASIRFIPTMVHPLADGISLHSAEILTDSISYGTNGMTRLVHGVMEQDDFRHELYVLIESNGKKVLFSGCSHRGILNIVSHFRPDILIGGFHLTKPETPADWENLHYTAAALSKFPITYYTGHCTSPEAFQVLKQHLRERLHSFSSGEILNI